MGGDSHHPDGRAGGSRRRLFALTVAVAVAGSYVEPGRAAGTAAVAQVPSAAATDTPAASASASPAPKKYVSPPLLLPLATASPAAAPTAQAVATAAATAVATVPPLPPGPPVSPVLPSTTLQVPVPAPASPAARQTRTPQNVSPHATVAPSLPTVPPAVTPTLAPRPVVPNVASAPSAGSLIVRAIAEARAETEHPFVRYRLHKQLVVSEAFSQDVAYAVTERSSDRLARFEDATTSAVHLGPPEPRRPDVPPALWGSDARDVNSGVLYRTAPSLLDGVHYDARVVGVEASGSGVAYRVLLEPHDGGLHDVLRSVLIDDRTGRILEVVTRRVVPLRISVAGKVRDVDIPADVTIDYDFVDNASVISHLRLLGDAAGHAADFRYDIDGVSFPAAVADDTFKPVAATAATAVAPAGTDADRIVPLPSLIGTGVTVIALGDSLVVGVGTNVCRGGCATSPTRTGSGTDVPGALQDIALAIARAGGRLTFVPLGVTGANTGEAPKAEDPASGDVLTNSGQLPQLAAAVEAARQRGDRVVVTLWSGNNDIFDAFYANECVATGGRVRGASGGSLPCASAGTTLAGSLGDVTGGSFYRGYLRVVHAIALARPDSIVALNIEDLARLPRSLILGPSERRRLSRDVDLANEAIVDALRDAAVPNAALVDVFGYANGRPELFGAPYVASDGLHPSELGYRAIAAEIARVAGARVEGIGAGSGATP